MRNQILVQYHQRHILSKSPFHTLSHLQVMDASMTRAGQLPERSNVQPHTSGNDKSDLLDRVEESAGKGRAAAAPGPKSSSAPTNDAKPAAVPSDASSSEDAKAAAPPPSEGPKPPTKDTQVDARKDAQADPPDDPPPEEAA